MTVQTKYNDSSQTRKDQYKKTDSSKIYNGSLSKK